MGTKLRLPHAVVITALYRQSKGLRINALHVAKMTFEHGRNLAYFAAVYKAVTILTNMLLSVLRKLTGHEHTRYGADVAVASPKHRSASVEIQHPAGRSEAPAASAGNSVGASVSSLLRPSHPLVAMLAGGAGAWLVWRHPSAVSHQILMYLLGRVLVSVVRSLATKGVFPFNRVSEKSQGMPWLAVATWTLVMLLFEFDRESLPRSLSSSMEALYHAPERWSHGPEGWRDFVPSAPWFAIAALLGAWVVESGQGWSGARKLLQVGSS